MEAVRNLEAVLAKQYKKAPHLPKEGQVWLAHNAWWIVLVGLALSVTGLVGILSVLALAMFGLSFGGALLGGAYGMTVGAALGGILLITTLVSLALYLVEVVLMGMAISPLKVMKKRGWDLVFLVAVLNALVTVVTNALSASLGGLVFGLLWAAVGLYFLFEVRDMFQAKKAAAKPAKSIKA
ncbi:MAG: hypothetical protein WAS27_00915 [Candidatus Saccharimonadales bacterium]